MHRHHTSSTYHFSSRASHHYALEARYDLRASSASSSARMTASSSYFLPTTWREIGAFFCASGSSFNQHTLNMD